MIFAKSFGYIVNY